MVLMIFLTAFWVAAILTSDSAWALNEHIVHLEHLGGGSTFGSSDRENSYTMVAYSGVIAGFWLALSYHSPLDGWMKKKGAFGFWCLILIYPLAIALFADLIFYRLWSISDYGTLTVMGAALIAVYFWWDFRRNGTENLEDSVHSSDSKKYKKQALPDNLIKTTGDQSIQVEGRQKEDGTSSIDLRGSSTKPSQNLTRASQYRPTRNKRVPLGATLNGIPNVVVTRLSLTESNELSTQTIRCRLCNLIGEKLFLDLVRKAAENRNFRRKAAKNYRHEKEIDALKVAETLLLELIKQSLEKNKKLESKTPLEWFNLPDNKPFSDLDFDQLVIRLAKAVSQNEKK
jgi:hypothetical protein